MLSSVSQDHEFLPSLTSSRVRYDEGLGLNAPPAQIGAAAGRVGGVLPLVLASLALVNVATMATEPGFGPSMSTNSSVAVVHGDAALPGKRITLREARLLALEVSRWTEEGLRADRAQEARLAVLAYDEDEHA